MHNHYYNLYVCVCVCVFISLFYFKWTDQKVNYKPPGKSMRKAENTIFYWLHNNSLQLIFVSVVHVICDVPRAYLPLEWSAYVIHDVTSPQLFNPSISNHNIDNYRNIIYIAHSLSLFLQSSTSMQSFVYMCIFCTFCWKLLGCWIHNLKKKMEALIVTGNWIDWVDSIQFH